MVTSARPSALDARQALQARLARLRALFEPVGIDALLVSQPENRRYFSGFSGSSGWLLVSSEAALLATDSRYWEQVKEECPAADLVEYGQGGRGFAEDGLPQLIERARALAPVARLGFEADDATYADVHAWLEHTAGVEWIPTVGLGIGLRAVKDEAEQAVLRAAVALADEALAAALAQARPGMSEADLAWVIESYMRTHGAEAPAFEIIVGAGPNGALPHHHPGDAPIVAGQPVVIDMGARLHGYCSDLTRTVCLGQPNDAGRFWEVYNTVLAAQAAVEAGLRPGMTGREGDALARATITAAGYGPNFGHGTGHGVGLAIHEEPGLGPSKTGELAAGHVVTVEPGIYLPGWGGVRIEDIVLITDKGVEVLTRAPKQPII